MSPPLPVPSKAAIHALRGLALGTSCAIGLIVEDRRRRISTLRTAIDNKKKLKSSRQYHGTTEAVSHAVQDPILLSGDELHWHYRQDRADVSQEESPIHISTNQRDPHSQEVTSQLAVPIAGAQQNTEQPSLPKRPTREATQLLKGPKAHILLQPTTELPAIKDSGGWARSPVKLSKNEPGRKIAELAEMPASSIIELFENDPTAFRPYLADLLADCETKTSYSKLSDGWLKVSAIISRRCQSKGKWLFAQKILAAVVRVGPLDEAQFFAYNPVATIDSILSNLDALPKDMVRERLQLATTLLLAKFNEKPKSHEAEMEVLGKALITRLLEFNSPGLVHPVYWRLLGQGERPEQFTAWFLQALFDYQDHKNVVKYFKLNFAKMKPDETCFNAVLRLVLDSVEAMRGAQVITILPSLAMLCDSTGLRPNVGWLIKLVEVSWSRYKDLEKSKEYFDKIKSTGLLSKVDEPEQLCQIMVKISVLADNIASADHYYQETTKLSPSMATDIWLNGYMALAKAKAGLWDGVLGDFSKMQPHKSGQEMAYDQTFVAVLKVFIQDHPIADVEDFIKLYTNKMGVRLHRYMVTLVANKYGELHDAKGFMQWLGHCCSAGFALDPAFSNAVLRNCRQKWNFPFQHLRQLFSAMRKLDPTCVDHVTERIMHNAAQEDGYYTGHNIAQRVRLLGISLSKLPLFNKSANERDVLHVMTEQVVRGYPVKAIVVYKRAVRFGMPWCPRCFRVAVTASLKLGDDNLGQALRLIGDAHQKGHDVTSAVAVFLKAQITQFRGTFEEVMSNLRNLIRRFEALGMVVDTSVLTHVAIVCTQFGQFDKAINLCNLAMEQHGTKNPCFSRQSLRALLMAYWQKLDVAGMRWLIESLLSSALADDRRAYRLLTSTKRHMNKWKTSTRVLEIKQILQDGIDEVKKRRAAQLEAGAMIYKETLRIMGDAAADMDLEEPEPEPEQDAKQKPGLHKARLTKASSGGVTQRVSVGACA